MSDYEGIHLINDENKNETVVHFSHPVRFFFLTLKRSWVILLRLHIETMAVQTW